MEQVDVIVIGGGAAGMAAALTLARAGRSVVVFDDSRPRNGAGVATTGIPWLDPAPAQVLQRRAREQLLSLGSHVQVVAEPVTAVRVRGRSAVVTAPAGDIACDAVILATGVDDVLPGVPGLEALWGTKVFGCPTCHGYETRGRRSIVIGDGDDGAMLTLYLRRYAATDAVPVLIRGTAPITPSLRHELDVRGIEVFDAPVASVQHDLDGVEVVLQGGEAVRGDFVFIRSVTTPRSDLARSVGCEVDDDGHVLVDEGFHTSIPPVYATGDLVRRPHVLPNAQVLQAAADGSAAAASCDQDLFFASLPAG